jgi:hypothetical protein
MQIWMKGFDGSITSCQEVGNAAQPSKARPGAVNAQVLEGPSQGRTGDNQDWRAPTTSGLARQAELREC